MKFAPWVLSGVLAVLLAAVFVMKNNQIDQLNQQLVQLTAQHNSFVVEAKQKEEKIVAEANNRLSEASRVISAASQPEVQVSVSTRQAMMGSGLVAMVRNDSGEMVALTIEAKRPSSGQSRSFDVVMNGGAIKEIGHVEGWAFVSGDTITVSQPNHKSKLFNI